MVGGMRDLTERREAEAALRQSEERFRATFEQAPIGMAEISPHGGFERVNPKLCEMFGFRPTNFWRSMRVVSPITTTCR